MSPCVGPGGIGWSDVRPSPQPDVSITRRSSFPAGSLARIVSNHPTKNSSQRKIGQERMGQRATTLRMQRRGPPADPEQSRSAPRILLADGHLRSRPPLFHTRSRAALTWCEPSLVENRSLARVSPALCNCFCGSVSVWAAFPPPFSAALPRELRGVPQAWGGGAAFEGWSARHKRRTPSCRGRRNGVTGGMP